jgi:tetratricopeptide (TPR) repeat protein
MLGQRTEAQRWLTAAIEKDPSLQPAYHNRALLDLDRAVREPGYRPVAGAADIEQAIELGPKTGELYRNAALLYAKLNESDPAFAASTIKYLSKAMEYGLPRSTIDGNPILSSIVSREGLGQPRAGKPASQAQFNSSYLVDRW